MHCQSQCPNSSRLNLAKVGGLHQASSWENRRVPLLLQVLALWEGNSLSPTLLARGGQHQPQRLQRGTLETCDLQRHGVDPHLSWPTPGPPKIGSVDSLGPLVSQVSWRFVRCVNAGSLCEQAEKPPMLWKPTQKLPADVACAYRLGVNSG